MLTLTPQDWTKVLNQKMAIRMGQSAMDITGHAYGLYDTPDPAKLTLVQKLQALSAPPADWYQRLFNTMSLIAQFTVGNPSVSYLLLLRGTVRCDQHDFEATGLHRGTGRSFPRVNLGLGGGNVAVASSQFLDSPHPQLVTDATKIDAFCDSVIRMIKAAP